MANVSAWFSYKGFLHFLCYTCKDMSLKCGYHAAQVEWWPVIGSGNGLPKSRWQPIISTSCHCLPHLDGLVQERRNSSALAMELRLSCINPSLSCVHQWGVSLHITSYVSITKRFTTHQDEFLGILFSWVNLYYSCCGTFLSEIRWQLHIDVALSKKFGLKSCCRFVNTYLQDQEYAKITYMCIQKPTYLWGQDYFTLKTMDHNNWPLD